jgi:hypothetical protein
MNRTELIKAINQAIGTLEVAYRSSATEADLYEAAVLSLSVKAAEDAGGSCLLTNDGVSRAADLKFRRGPGNLWMGPFTYALISFPGTAKMLEIHLGVYVLSRYKVAHECDVAILDHREAERSRLGRVHPRQVGLIAAIEAKNYAISPGLGVGRGFLGLSSELGQGRCSLVFPASSSANIAALIAKRPSEAFDDLLPVSPAAQRLRAHLDQSIRNWRSRR